MGGSGRVLLQTSRVQVDAEYQRLHPEVPPGYYAMLTVADHGCGMDKATQERIFEPFFTTKSADEGTGLGLAVVHGIVRQNHGHVQCYSELGHGTCFSVSFPSVTEAVDAPGEAAEPATAPVAGGAERILIVEDDDAVRTLASTTLSRAGYEVIAVASAAEALAIGQRPALLIADLTLRETDGFTVAKAVRAAWPGVHVLYVSGYPAASAAAHASAPDMKHFLPKPFSPLQLREAVRDILDG
jgi:CheY-like chemotaxis protein